MDPAVWRCFRIAELIHERLHSHFLGGAWADYGVGAAVSRMCTGVAGALAGLGLSNRT